MGKFVGWVPTIVGRVAFSRVGNNLRQHPEVCNLAYRSDGFVFGREQRTSPDGPLPAWILRRFRQPDQLFSIFLEVVPSKLPREKEPGKTELIDDVRGALEGHLYFFSKSKLSKQHRVDARLDEVGRLAAGARSPRANEARQREHFNTARDASASLFAQLVEANRIGQQVPAFARAKVRLDRTGRCEIELGPNDLFIDRKTKLAHRAGIGTPRWFEAKDAFDSAERFISRHAYNVVRDLAHRHYHHHHHADLLATTYEWSPADDQAWRRETLYGLARMAIEIRRRGSAKAFKQCAGVVAYAEAFQTHLGGWSLAEDGSVQDAETVPPYDFAALRNSIDASLKVRELEDAERRQSILYLTTIFLAALALVVAGVRGLEREPANGFEFGLHWITSHPIETLIVAVTLGWFIDLSFLRAALPLPATRTFYYGLKRATAAVMGSLIWRGLPAWLSYALGLLGLLMVILAAAAISALAGYGLFYKIG